MAHVKQHRPELARGKGPRAKLLLLAAKFNEFLIIKLKSVQIPDFMFPPQIKASLWA